MDELEVGGKKYISSKRASEITAYAKDYIGQLARAGKVPGTRFGRAWFVDEEALLRYLGTSTNETSVDEPVVAAGTRTERKALLTHHLISPTTLPKTWSDVKYIEDSSELFPVLVPRIAEERPPFEEAVAPLSSSSVIPNRTGALTTSVERRVAQLVDGIQPKKAVLRIASKSIDIPTPPRKAPSTGVQQSSAQVPKRVMKVGVRWSRGDFSTALAAFVFLFGSALSFSLFAGIAVEHRDASMTASASYGFDEFILLIRDSRILENGLQGLAGFYYLLRDSFGNFVQTALNFIAGLL